MNDSSRRDRPEAGRSIGEFTPVRLSQASEAASRAPAGFPDPLTRQLTLYREEDGVERAAKLTYVLADVVAWLRDSGLGKVELNAADHGFPERSVIYSTRGVGRWRKAW